MVGFVSPRFSASVVMMIGATWCWCGCSMCWISVPPLATLVICKPRQMPR